MMNDGRGRQERGERYLEWIGMYHKQSPNGVVEEDDGCCDEHCEANEAVQLVNFVSHLFLNLQSGILGIQN